MIEILEIPLINTEPRFKIRTTLDNIELILKIDWNDRAQRFQMSVFDSDENALVEGICMNVDTELLHRYLVSGLPRGKLVLYDTSKTHAEAGINAGISDLGDRCKLIYQTES